MNKPLNINPPAPNPNDYQFRFQILQVCSSNFLTDPLPNDWYDLADTFYTLLSGHQQR